MNLKKAREIEPFQGMQARDAVRLAKYLGLEVHQVRRKGELAIKSSSGVTCIIQHPRRRKDAAAHFVSMLKQEREMTLEKAAEEAPDMKQIPIPNIIKPAARAVEPTLAEIVSIPAEAKQSVMQPIQASQTQAPQPMGVFHRMTRFEYDSYRKRIDHELDRAREKHDAQVAALDLFYEQFGEEIVAPTPIPRQKPMETRSGRHRGTTTNVISSLMKGLKTGELSKMFTASELAAYSKFTSEIDKKCIRQMLSRWGKLGLVKDSGDRKRAGRGRDQIVWEIVSEKKLQEALGIE